MKFYGFSLEEIAWIEGGFREIQPFGTDRPISISFNHDERFGVPDAKKKVLVLYEPECVMPWQYTRKNLDDFDLIICLNPWRAKENGFDLWEYQPIVRPKPTKNQQDASCRDLKIVMINANKFSSIKKSGYSLRRKAIIELEKNSLDFALFGIGWDMNKTLEIRKRFSAIRDAIKARSEKLSFREALTEFGRKYNSYRGSLASKEEVLKRAEICIVIENDFSTLSEKVFDAIYAGCVPIYVGPDLSSIQGLSDCVIPVEPNARKIIEKLNGLTSMELQMRRDAIEVFTKSPNSMDFCAPPKVWSNVGRLIAGAILH